MLEDDNTTSHRLAESSGLARLDARTGQILGTLRGEPGISLRMFCVMKASESGIWAHKSIQGFKREWQGEATLYVNIYRPESLFDAIGIFASDCALFLQDPRDCDRQVIYRNPHRMSFGPSPITYTQAVATHDTSPPEIEEFSGSLDPFHDPELAKDLPETEPDEVLKTGLYS